MSPMQGVVTIGLGVVLGLLLYDAIKALYRWGKDIPIDWDSVGIFAGVAICVVIIFVMTLAAVYGFIEMFSK